MSDNSSNNEDDDTDIPLVRSLDIEAIRKEATELPKINEDSDIISIVTKLYNGDKLNYNYGVKSDVTTKELYSNLYNKTILKTTSTVSSNVKSTYAIDIYAEDKDLDYIYDLAGNITEIKINGKIAYKYSYDPHGRLISEKDFIHGVGAKYGYDSTSNILSITRGRLNENNNIVIDSNSEMIADYGNANWPDQLTEFDGKSITYDNVGNPLEYLEKYSFTWSKGRQLSKITDKKTQQEISLKYNESGLRIYKDTDKLNTEYTWDEGKLLREQVVYKATGKKYDIWYFFDNMGEVVGFEYSYIGDDGTKEKNRIYFIRNYTQSHWNTKMLDMIINDLKDHRLYNYSMMPKIKIYTSKENITTLKEKRRKWEQKYYFDISNCEEQYQEEGYQSLSPYCKKIIEENW